MEAMRLNKAREEICRKCKMLPSFHHPDYPCCHQLMALTDDEWAQIGASKTDKVTKDVLLRMMQITIIPYCYEKMITGGEPI
jgi:hypothetical protein